MLKDLLIGRGPGRGPRSLRAELLFNLAFLAAAALFLALWTARILELLFAGAPHFLAILVLLVAIDVVAFVALGNYLVDRLVVRPLAQTVDVAQAIASGDYERRAPPGDTAEIAALSVALNGLTDQLLRNQETLAQNVRSLDETNRLLHETQQELVQAEKMASIGRLGAGVAHEIGNPLSALLGYVAVLRKRDPDADLLQEIEREARRIDQIVRGLLDYARPGAARREPVDVNAAVRRVVGLLRNQGQLAGIEVRLELAELPRVEAVPHRVDQMFVNLFTNAIAAMQGSGRIVVTSALERYRPARAPAARRADDPPGVDYSHLRRLRYGTAPGADRLEADQEVIHLVVADTGPGIPPEHINQIFDPFFTTKAPGQGTGLGLAIVASTVAELGGRIEASSAQGGGATFHLYLPASEAKA